MEMLTVDQLCVLLLYALDRMNHAGVRLVEIYIVNWTLLSVKFDPFPNDEILDETKLKAFDKLNHYQTTKF